MDYHERPALAEARRLVEALRGLSSADAPDVRPGVLTGVGLADAAFRIDSPIGPVFVAHNPLGVSAVAPAADAAAFAADFRARFGRAVYVVVEPPAVLRRAVERRLRGERAAIRFDLRGLSEFERATLLKALEVPRGEVRPYGWIAREIGRPRAVRAVGTALGHNPVPLLIPCHRIVRSDGHVGNYAFGSAAKHVVLSAEGIVPDELERLARRRVRYTGSDTTHIFCYPTCHNARRAAAQHSVSFASEAEARAAGYRPCKVCRPALAS